mmetsp:Transcript_30596/g.90821  ORF Transcript_30596/g.90821 Transcript_30596/m.90821 type:complete len:300 (-) Transcript_30596:1111-2010(-)
MEWHCSISQKSFSNMSPWPAEKMVTFSIFSSERCSREKGECMRSPWPFHRSASSLVSMASYSWNCAANSTGSACRSASNSSSWRARAATSSSVMPSEGPAERPGASAAPPSSSSCNRRASASSEPSAELLDPELPPEPGGAAVEEEEEAPDDEGAEAAAPPEPASRSRSGPAATAGRAFRNRPPHPTVAIDASVEGAVEPTAGMSPGAASTTPPAPPAPARSNNSAARSTSKWLARSATSASAREKPNCCKASSSLSCSAAPCSADAPSRPSRSIACSGREASMVSGSVMVCHMPCFCI